MMPKPKILFVALRMAVGGVEISLLSLLKSLPAHLLDIHLALISKGSLLDSEIPPYVTVHQLPMIEQYLSEFNHPVEGVWADIRDGRYKRAYKTTIAIIKSLAQQTRIPYYDRFLKHEPTLQQTFDVAINYNCPNELLDWYVARYIKAHRKIGWVHFDVSKWFTRKVTSQRAYQHYNRIYVVADSSRKQFDKMFPMFADRTEVFHNIVNRQRVIELGFQPCNSNPLPNGVKRIVTVGRIQHVKGQDLAIEAAAILKSRGIKFVWHLVGTGSDEAQYKALAASKWVADCISFEGLQINPYPFMRMADVYVQTSRSEGFCITLAEAKCFNAPIVSTQFSGVEQIANRPHSHIVSHSPWAIADAVQQALSEGPINSTTDQEPNQAINNLVAYLRQGFEN